MYLVFERCGGDSDHSLYGGKIVSISQKVVKTVLSVFPRASVGRCVSQF